MGRKRKDNSGELESNLLQAIDQATHPGKCKYVIDEQPACIIAHLCVIEGIDVSTIKKWDTHNRVNKNTKESERIKVLIENNVRGTQALKKYPINVLDKIQWVWDTYQGSITHLKNVLKDFVGLVFAQKD